jgi:3-hydroxyisobutyrate dehydrogenase-like beta-hydroxyacid dehydrogenase
VTGTGDVTVGFLGLGAMGGPMAARVLVGGHRLVVWNRSPARAEPLVRAGAERAETPADVVREADVVLGCLLDGPAVEQVYLSGNRVSGGEVSGGVFSGMAASARPGQVFVEHGTFAPELACRVAAELRARGAVFLDAPVTGGPEGARAGTLTTMVGGDKAALEQVAPVLARYADRIHLVGGSGAGLELKLVNQMLVSCHVAAAAEAAAVLRRRGLPLDIAREVLGSGWAASTMLERTLTRLLDDDTVGTGATIGGLLEPQRLARELAEAGVSTGAGVEAGDEGGRGGLPLVLLPQVITLFEHARDLGLGDRDLAALVGALDVDLSS